ncbi:hypothetical protein HanPI659440_Chr14g0573751 [Helianthus annuus]|nr:hypothetical protein HanPI659440_Chr14g0573751 [Helianthus annuus]
MKIMHFLKCSFGQLDPEFIHRRVNVGFCGCFHFICYLLLDQRMLTEHVKEPCESVCGCILSGNHKTQAVELKLKTSLSLSQIQVFKGFALSMSHRSISWEIAYVVSKKLF